MNSPCIAKFIYLRVINSENPGIDLTVSRNQNIGVSKSVQLLFKYMLGAFISVNNADFTWAL